jgi:hypothetical protein
MTASHSLIRILSVLSTDSWVCSTCICKVTGYAQSNVWTILKRLRGGGLVIEEKLKICANDDCHTRYGANCYCLTPVGAETLNTLQLSERVQRRKLRGK